MATERWERWTRAIAAQQRRRPNTVPDVFREFKRELSRLPTSVQHEVASKAAPKLTQMTREAFASFRSVYGDARPAGDRGQALTLVRSGSVRDSLGFQAIGTLVRAVLRQDYARFLIGKYKVLPMGQPPDQWWDELRAILDQYSDRRRG